MSLSAQTFYIELQQLFNRIDGDLIEEPEQIRPITLMRLDSVRQDTFIFAKHALKGLKICAFANDSIRIRRWCRLAVSHGFRTYQLERFPILKDIRNYISIDEENEIHEKYMIRIQTNKDLSAALGRRFAYDQKLTQYINDGKPGLKKAYITIKWYFNNKTNFRFIKKVINDFEYPGESCFGISQDTIIAGTPGDFRAFYMLMHYYSNSRNNLIEQLIIAAHHGQILPVCVGVIADYRYTFGHRGKPYGEWLSLKKPDLILQADSLRNNLGLCSYAQAQVKDKLYKNKSLKMIRSIGFE